MTAEATRSSRIPELAFPALALLGFVVSLYLWYVHVSGASALCVGVGGCETVNASRYSEISGVPVSVLGAFTYLALLAIWLIRPRLDIEWQTKASLAIFGITLTGVLFSAYLTYLELFVIYAICPWCVSSAVIIIGLFVLSIREIRGLLAD